MLRGTNLGNWLVREGYMFHFEGGPQSAREIEALTNELLGPEAADKFWKAYLDALCHARRHPVSEARRLQFDSHPDPLQIFRERQRRGLPPARSRRSSGRARPACMS